jgi:AcrR family transcriptional regulator
MLLFWRHGYEATSLNELTAAMGITPPSIYTAFGDKKRLFLEAINRYVSGPTTSESIIESAETAEQAVRTLLQTAATGFTGKHTPRGCLLASSAISCSPAATDVQHELARIRRKIEMRLRDKIARGVRTGELNAYADAASLAAFTMAVIQGMSTLARDGATRERLMKISETAMQSFCSAKKK